MRRAWAVWALVPLLALGLASCDWPTFHGGASRSGWQSSESKISAANVSSLQPVRSYPLADAPPVVAGGVLYSVESTGFVRAYDATGMSGCHDSPKVCDPLWTAKFRSRSVTVDNGKVYAAGFNGGGMVVYDAAGVAGCHGSPKVCDPLWTTGTFRDIGDSSPAVVDGVVYVTGRRSINAAPGNAYVIAYDANGSTNCVATVCSPLWWSTAAPTDVDYTEALAVANGIVYAVAGSKVVAFDAKGSSSCSGSPKVCAPLWTASPPTSLAYSGAAVGNGALFVAGYGGKLYAYDAAGTSGCSGSPKTCSPLWSAQVDDTHNTPAVANGTVYVTATSGWLRAFDATGATGCSGTPKVCAPLWSYNPDVGGSVVTGSPAVANGLVYTVSPGSVFSAFDAAGSIGCSGTPRTCTPLWTADADVSSTDASPAIVDGTVYWNSRTWGTTRAYGLPN